jgi:hypothetical protein
LAQGILEMRVDDAADGIGLPSSRERIHDGHGVGWITSLCGGWTLKEREDRQQQTSGG